MDPIVVERNESLLDSAADEARGGLRTIVVLIGVVAATVGAVWLGWQWYSAAATPDNVMVPPVASTPLPVAPPKEIPPPIEHPMEATPATEPLPSLDDSDGAVGKALAALVGGKTFTSLFVPERLVRHIVATVDNLPRSEAPVKRWPVHPAGSWLETTGSGDTMAISPKNAARYAPYLKMVRAVDAQQLAALYREYYPLFQDAYRELGYPEGHFNDRLVVAIDNLLATPEPKTPPLLVQEKVRYQFADGDLERRSAGQKILLRIGVENARVVKAKLREFRQYVAKPAG